MRKRSKIRLPQDIRPWSRVTVREDDFTFELFNKKSLRGNLGSKRDYNTAALQCYNISSTPTTLICTLLSDHTRRQQASLKKQLKLRKQRKPTQKVRQAGLFDIAKQDIRRQIRLDKKMRISAYLSNLSKVWSDQRKVRSLGDVKNFCLVLGKSRTYNRHLFISRQTVRKMAKVGLLAGIQK